MCVFFVDTFFSLNKENPPKKKLIQIVFFSTFYSQRLSLNIYERHVMDTSIRNILHSKINTSV